VINCTIRCRSCLQFCSFPCRFIRAMLARICRGNFGLGNGRARVGRMHKGGGMRARLGRRGVSRLGQDSCHRPAPNPLL